MGASSPKVFPAPGSYAMDDENVIQPQDPTPIIPQQQFVSMNSYSQAGAPAATPVNGVRQAGGGGRGKFFGDDFDPSLYGKKKQGGGGLPSSILPPPVKLPHDVGYF